MTISSLSCISYLKCFNLCSLFGLSKLVQQELELETAPGLRACLVIETAPCPRGDESPIDSFSWSHCLIFFSCSLL